MTSSKVEYRPRKNIMKVFHSIQIVDNESFSIPFQMNSGHVHNIIAHANNWAMLVHHKYICRIIMLIEAIVDIDSWMGMQMDH